MGAGSVLHKAGTKNIEELGGLMKRMPITGRTFLVGSVAISGLPPFSGFIGEFLIYYGAFQGLTSVNLPFVLTVLAIISLAVIGGMATACFTKVVGLAFLGEPRTEQAANAEEAGWSMGIVMGIMAVTCLVIGVYPEPFIRLAFSGIQDVAATSGFNTDAFMGIVQQLSKTAVLFLAILAGVSLFRRLLYIKKEIGSGGTWGCGFTQPTVRMQYTGTSYAYEMVEFFNPFVPIKNAYSGIKKIFPGQTTWHSEVNDIAETAYQRYLITPMFSLIAKLKWIQHGNIQLYIAYIIIAIIVLLLFL
jgi:hydrogenase-4 component B